MYVDIDDALNYSGHGLYSYAVLATCSVINHAAFLDLLSFGVALPIAMCELNIDMTESGLLTSIPLAGCIFSIPWGYYADTQGRRKALILSTSVGCLFAVASTLAPNWQSFFVLKFIGSCFFFLPWGKDIIKVTSIKCNCYSSSAGNTVTMTYLGECTIETHRSKYMFILNSSNLACDIVLFALAYLIFPLQIDVPIPWLSIRFTPWRLYLFTIALLLGLGCIMVIFLSESPKFLAAIGKPDEAVKVLKRVHRINKRNKEDFLFGKLKQPEKENDSQSFWMSVVNKTVPIFKPPLLWRTMQIFYLFTVCYTTINVFYMWFPLFVNNLFSSNYTMEEKSFCGRISANSSTHGAVENATCDTEMSQYTIFSGIFYGVVLTALNLALSLAARWRRLVLICILVVSALCLTFLNLITQPIAAVVVFSMIMVSGIAVGNVTTYFNDMYPTSYRGLATSLGSMTARMSSFAGVNILGAAVAGHCNMFFYSWAVFVLTGIGVAMFLPPDCKPSKL